MRMRTRLIWIRIGTTDVFLSIKSLMKNMEFIELESDQQLLKKYSTPYSLLNIFHTIWNEERRM